MANLTIEELERLVYKVEDDLDGIEERVCALEDFVGKLETRFRAAQEGLKDGGQQV